MRSSMKDYLQLRRGIEIRIKDVKEVSRIYFKGCLDVS